MTEHILDNPTWLMLCHDLAEYSSGTALAKRCDVNLIPVAAVANHSESAFADLAKLYNAGEVGGIMEANPPQEIPDFQIINRSSFDQLVCQQRTPIPAHDVEIIELTPADTQDIAQLIDLTKPGPFFPNLLKIRRFIGIRQAGELIAMAGERWRLPGYNEISAVCTHPDWRGRGYGRLLTSIMADSIWEQGNTPFLHVDPNNASAYQIYTGLHFLKRSTMTIIFIART